MAQIADLVIRIGADTKEVQSGLHAIQRTLQHLQRIGELAQLKSKETNPWNRFKYDFELRYLGQLYKFYSLRSKTKQSYNFATYIFSNKPVYTLEQLRWRYPEIFRKIDSGKEYEDE